MKCLTLLAAVFGVLLTVLPVKAQAQYWPNMKDFNVESSDKATAVLVKSALEEGKYRAEIANLRKAALDTKPRYIKDIDVAISTVIQNTLSQVKAQRAKVEDNLEKTLAERNKIQHPYAVIDMYTALGDYDSISTKLMVLDVVVNNCAKTLNQPHVAVKEIDYCSKVLSNRTLSYAKIANISFRKDDRATCISALESLNFTVEK